jgi:hypothetical protein
MPHEPDHEQIKMLLLRERHNGLDGVAGKEVRLDREPGCLGLRLRCFEHRRQAMVRFALLLLDLVDAGGKPRQLLDSHHVERRFVLLCQCQSCVKRARCAGRTVVCHEDFPVHASSLPWPSRGPRTVLQQSCRGA